MYIILIINFLNNLRDTLKQVAHLRIVESTELMLMRFIPDLKLRINSPIAYITQSSSCDSEEKKLVIHCGSNICTHQILKWNMLL